LSGYFSNSQERVIRFTIGYAGERVDAASWEKNKQTGFLRKGCFTWPKGTKVEEISKARSEELKSTRKQLAGSRRLGEERDSRYFLETVPHWEREREVGTKPKPRNLPLTKSPNIGVGNLSLKRGRDKTRKKENGGSVAGC